MSAEGATTLIGWALKESTLSARSRHRFSLARLSWWSGFGRLEKFCEWKLSWPLLSCSYWNVRGDRRGCGRRLFGGWGRWGFNCCRLSWLLGLGDICRLIYFSSFGLADFSRAASLSTVILAAVLLVFVQRLEGWKIQLESPLVASPRGEWMRAQLSFQLRQYWW